MREKLQAFAAEAARHQAPLRFCKKKLQGAAARPPGAQTSAGPLEGHQMLVCTQSSITSHLTSTEINSISDLVRA